MASSTKTTKDKRLIRDEKLAKKRVRRTRRRLLKLREEGRLPEGV